MNILNFINNIDLNTISKLDDMPISFRLIDLHTRNLEKAKSQCDEFFCTKRDEYYYTDSSDYQWYGGWKYKLSKANDGIYWLVLQNTIQIEV